MKEKDITPEVIKLSKDIADIWRMEIYVGCFLTDETGKLTLSISNEPSEVWFPIPSISDVLTKLQERHEFMPDYYNKKDFNRSLLNIFKNYIEGKFTITEVHYWLLSALLEVLKK